MKKKALILMLIMAVFSTMFLSACGSSKTLEDYVANNTEMQESINAAMEGSDVLVEVKDNEVIYTYDLSKMDGYTEELIKDEAVIASLDSTLTSIAPTFGGISKTLEEKTKIKGITTTVKYTWGDEEIITKSFNSADAAENTAE